ncbi:tail protein [Pseudomonas phage PspYZU05]|uniref:Tail tube protein n=1 Tax=Pseudomonas phage PspYZU05 TaxID=1983556 RepID=A0A2U7NS06_9CAUD|nr:tail protein [Pseudomonas phage PspYZU05]ASD52082.1 tail tube protein [Pseudomonas phage PspYZU05]
MFLDDITRAFESGDFARPNLFEVEIPHMGRNFSFKCKAAAMPAGVVEKIPVGYMNRKVNIAGDRIYDDWTVTIYNDDKHDVRQDLSDWQSIAHGGGNEITGGTPAQYKKPAIVRQFSRDGKTITKEITISGVWPTNVGEVVLDWDSNNEVQTFETTFAIDWWE